MSLAKHHTFTFRVYIEDTDMMGIVYHANYLRFFERARSEWLRDSNFPLTALATDDCHFIISDIQLKFLHAARLDELLTVTTQSKIQGKCSILFEQLMENQDNSPICKATIKIVCVDGNMKIRRLPEQFIDIK